MTSVREILEAVAEGRIDPAEATRLIDEARAAEAGADGATGAATAPGTEQPAGGTARAGGPPAVPELQRVLVRATSRKVRLVGDPSVTTVAVEGEHHLRREGTTLVVTAEGERFLPDDAFTLLSSGRWRDVTGRLGLGNDIRVRVRPDLPVDVEVIAGSLTSEGVTALERVRVTAGSAKVSGVEGPVDVLVQAGSAVVEGALRRGQSRVRAESGSVRVHLLAGSDVRIRTDVQLGKVVSDPPLRDGELTVGTAFADLDVEAVMGSAVIKVER
ncbi:MAG TPA: hypothetical protein VK894_01890 [Jiangellales bacterium]|nr:hypothetical protein [Jiangellales bacterium]